ncbi:MAG: hypothetical protein JNM61_03300 [Zoogloeaceae bacterium]|nr:hypothetical protein [Zoogloeaceae bacterium]
MENNKLNPQVIRRFMKAAAIAFAVGSAPAMAKNRPNSPDRPEPPRSSAESPAARKPSEQRFHLALRPARGIQGEPAPEQIRVRVLDARGRCHIDTTVSGPCRLGPLTAGEYMVLFKAQGRFDWRRLTLGEFPVPEILVRGVA